jgi:hypothetical protein
MMRSSNTSDQDLSLKYGLAVVTFGQRAVEDALGQAKWSEKYPELFDRLESTNQNVIARANLVLPGEIVYEIAGNEKCRDDYYADPDGERLYAVDRIRVEPGPPAAEARGHRKIPNQLALVTYGAYCLFSASDKGIGYKGERDQSRA